MKILIKDGFLLDGVEKSGKPKKAHIIIEGDKIGRITNKIEEKEKFSKIINARECLLIPGLINSHNHSYGNLLKGTTENIPLEVWKMDAIAGGANRSSREIYVSTLLGCIEMVKSGTTAVLDHLSLNEEGLRAALKAYEDIGMRAAIAPMFDDKPYYETLLYASEIFPEELISKANLIPKPSVSELITTCKNLIQDFNNKESRLSIMIGPSAPQRCSTKLLEKVIELAEEKDVGLHTHLLETKTQAVTSIEKYDKSLTKFLREIGFLQERTSLAHGVWLSDEDIEVVAGSGASIVHNPIPNLILGSGIAPILKFINSGINIALGTDGPNCGGNQILFEAMRFAATLHKVKSFDNGKWIKAEQVLKFATSGGAKVHLKENKIGKLKEGYKADIVLLDLNTSNLVPLNNPINLLVYSENGSSVRDVFVDGKMIVENRKVLNIDEIEVFKEARVAIKSIMNKNRKLFKFFKRGKPYVNQVYKRATAKEIGFNRRCFDE